MFRFFTCFLISLPLVAQCYLPEVSADAVAHLSPSAMVDAGHYREAEGVLKPVVREMPHDAKSAWLLSRAEAALGNLDEAMTLAEAALAEDNSNANYHVQVAVVAGRLAEKASLMKQIGYAKRIKQEFDSAATLDAANADAQWGLMMFYYAAPSLIGGDKAKAWRIGEQMTPKLLSLYYQGRLAYEMKDFDKAESFYRQAAGEDPTFYDVSAALAKLYIEDRPDQTRARIWACQTVHTDPTRADAWALLAQAYTMCGCWTEARDAVHRAELVDGANAAPLYMQLGLALEKLGHTEEALAELKAASELDSSVEGLKAALKRVSSAAEK